MKFCALLLLLPFFLAGCDFLSSPSISRNPIEHSVGMQIPPGSREEFAVDSFVMLVKQAESFELQRRPIEALRLYRQALNVTPQDISPDQQQRVRQRISHLSFILGIPENSLVVASETSTLSSNSLSAGLSSQSLAKARDFYRRGIEAESAGHAIEAMLLFKEVLKLVSEKDEPELYWNAWQRMEDLSPERPAAESTEATEADEPGDGAPLDEGTAVRSERDFDGYSRADDANLAKAREVYMKGMEYAGARESKLARQSFSEVLSLIRESQDPELYRAARQNLLDLGATSKN